MRTRSVHKLRITSSLVFAAAVGSAIVACSSRQGFHQDAPLLEADAGTPDAAPPTCGIHCSRDLKQVLDGCDGAETVVATCNADQGCGEGRCVDACTAAALTKGSVGCDFWTVAPVSTGQAGSCLAVLIANTWDRAVTLEAEYGDRALDISKSAYRVERPGESSLHIPLEGPLSPGQVAVIFLAHNPSIPGAHACPSDVTPAVPGEPVQSTTTKKPGFHIKADAPVSAYSIAPYGGAASYTPTATLLLPSSSWTTSYMTVTPFRFTRSNSAPLTPRTLQIVAAEDDTEIRMRPTSDIAPGPGVEGARAGEIQTWTLARGEVLQVSQHLPLTGSPISTSKPVGVFGGAGVINQPYESGWGDWLQQQIPPLSHWGTEYAVVPFLSRIDSLSGTTRERVPYTIVAAADGTMLSYEPSRPRDAPELLAAGESANFVTDEIFVVKSQDASHPFHVNVYMTGGSSGAGVGTNTLGDPDWVNIAPTAQYLDRYVFFTDYTYPETSLTVVRKKTPSGFMPVELECAGDLTGFQPLGSDYEYAWVRLTRGFVGQPFPKGICGYGRQEAHSKGPFSITVWGIGIAASYGYVGGTGLRPINDLPPAVLN